MSGDASTFNTPGNQQGKDKPGTSEVGDFNG